jgi:hypothetical protein
MVEVIGVRQTWSAWRGMGEDVLTGHQVHKDQRVEPLSPVGGHQLGRLLERLLQEEEQVAVLPTDLLVCAHQANQKELEEGHRVFVHPVARLVEVAGPQAFVHLVVPPNEILQAFVHRVVHLAEVAGPPVFVHPVAHRDVTDPQVFVHLVAHRDVVDPQVFVHQAALRNKEEDHPVFVLQVVHLVKGDQDSAHLVVLFEMESDHQVYGHQVVVGLQVYVHLVEIDLQVYVALTEDALLVLDLRAGKDRGLVV